MKQKHMMDRSRVVNGQEVWINSGCYCDKGRVVKVTPEEVEVKVDTASIWPGYR